LIIFEFCQTLSVLIKFHSSNNWDSEKFKLRELELNQLCLFQSSRCCSSVLNFRVMRMHAVMRNSKICRTLRNYWRLSVTKVANGLWKGIMSGTIRPKSEVFMLLCMENAFIWNWIFRILNILFSVSVFLRSKYFHFDYGIHFWQWKYNSQINWIMIVIS